MEPILVGHLFAPLNDELVSLLRGVREDEWEVRAVGSWSVKDVTAHLLDTSLRRLSSMPIPDFEPNRVNSEWIVAMKRVSPRILIDMIDRYGREQAELLASLDPFARAQFGVTWAGEEESLNWFDAARELTERWHHQQQIRDALNREPLFEPYLGPVIDTFVRGVPHAYRSLDAPDGTNVVLLIGDAWSLRRENAGWTLRRGARLWPASTTITIDPDSAWRLFTKARAKQQPRVEGDPRLADPLLRMICVIG
jgi:uncharacterized protein (TIGR03083 family)